MALVLRGFAAADVWMPGCAGFVLRMRWSVRGHIRRHRASLAPDITARDYIAAPRSPGRHFACVPPRPQKPHNDRERAVEHYKISTEGPVDGRRAGELCAAATAGGIGAALPRKVRVQLMSL
jgi:hypothetical protein